jgi:Flp pilus assembly protein TadG
MLEAWALKNWKSFAAGLFVLLLLALGGLGFWRGLVAIERMQTAAADGATRLCNAGWETQIAKSNVAIATARTEQVLASARADAASRDVESQVEARLKQLGKANAALPGGDHCGIGRDRVRLLNDR